jgi:hypothetical protein
MQERFFAKTKLADQLPVMATPCLEWTASRNRKGYGQFRLDGKTERAHRVAWQIAHGPIPDGLHVLHKCDNPPCVAVEHLFLGTDADNAADRDAKGRHLSARGDAHGTHRHPESLVRGDAHWSRQHPECLARGEQNGRAKLNADNVRAIHQRRAQGLTLKQIAAKFGVSFSQISAILARKRWAHVDLNKES